MANTINLDISCSHKSKEPSRSLAKTMELISFKTDSVSVTDFRPEKLDVIK